MNKKALTRKPDDDDDVCCLFVSESIDVFCCFTFRFLFLGFLLCGVSLICKGI